MRIADLHARSLDNTDDAASQRITQQLDDLVADTSALSNVLKRRIKALEKQPGSGRDGQIRKQQVSTALFAGLILRASPFCDWARRLTSMFVADGAREAKIRRGYSELPGCRTAVPREVQTAFGTAIQDWYVSLLIFDKRSLSR